MTYITKQLSIEVDFVETPRIWVIEDITGPLSAYVELNKFCSYNGLTLHSIVQTKRTTIGIFK